MLLLCELLLLRQRLVICESSCESCESTEYATQVVAGVALSFVAMEAFQRVLPYTDKARRPLLLTK